MSGLISSNRLTTTSARLRNDAGRLVATAMHAMPARLAEVMPSGAFSMTTQSRAETPSLRQAIRYGSGCGFPRLTILPVTMAWKKRRTRAGRIARTSAKGVPVTRPSLYPLPCRHARSSTQPGKIYLVKTRLNAFFLSSKSFLRWRLSGVTPWARKSVPSVLSQRSPSLRKTSWTETRIPRERRASYHAIK